VNLNKLLFQAARKVGVTFNDAYCRELAEAGEKMFKEAEATFPLLEFQAYNSAAGHSIDLRSWIKGPGVKKTSFTAQWDNVKQGKRLMAMAVVQTVVNAKWNSGPLKMTFLAANGTLGGKAKDQEDRENNIKRAVVDVVRDELCKKHGSAIQKTLDALKPDSDSLQKALEGVEKNKKRSAGASRKHALVRLADAMRSHDFTEEEVLEAWQMSQVERVMES
jgi:hypothetical protein